MFGNDRGVPALSLTTARAPGDRHPRPTADRPPVLEARGLVVRRGGRRTLDIERFTVGDRETVAVVGPNGAGKSTLLLVMAALLRPSQGQLLVHGTPVRPRRALAFRRRIGLVLADPLLLDTTVRKNVAAGLRFRGVRGRSADMTVDAWLDRLGVLSLRDRSARDLSSGEAQRVSLARALVLDPEILLLDEPFASVDVAARAQLLDDTERLLRDSPRACLLVTHDLDEASRLGTRMSVVVRGRLRQDDLPHRVLATPVDDEVAAFVGVETRLPGTIVSARDDLAVIEVAGRRIEALTMLPVGRSVLCCLRPEDITVSTVPGHERTAHPAGARNLLTGSVARLTSKGQLVQLTVDCGVPVVAALTKRCAAELDVRPGDRVAVVFPASAVHVIGLPP